MDKKMNRQQFSANPDINDQGLGIKVPVVTGIIIILLFFGIFGVWAAIAPLESAAIAVGVVSVDSKRKTIQHLEGGIIGEINIREGDEVKAGDILIHLDDTQPRANLELLQGRMMAARALEARLLAERDNKQHITFPDELTRQQEDKDVAEIIDGQLNIFNAGRQSLAGKVAIIKKQIQQSEEQLQGLNGIVKAQNEQIELVKDEIDSNRKLFEKGLTGKRRLMELQRGLAGLIGKRGQNVASIAEVKQNIDEALLQIDDVNASALDKGVRQLDDVQREQYDLTEKIRGLEDVLERMVIKSPLDGTVVNLRVHTIGGVIAPGQELMDIVPMDDRLIIEARLDPKDIDVVKAGLKAHVRLTAFNQRQIQPIEGRVITVSADRFIDKRTGANYFLSRVELTGKINDDMKIYPGMQAEVMIVTGMQTTLDYLMRPVTQSMNRAFREN